MCFLVVVSKGAGRGAGEADGREEVGISEVGIKCLGSVKNRTGMRN